MFIGVLLLILGVLLLLREMGLIYGNVWDYVWPIALIALGASMIFKNKR
ncbi:hypothetical protein KQH82_08365 [bacterium]|nr:hypothetical protein [bacterium]